MSHCKKCGQVSWLPRVFESIQKENEALRKALKFYAKKRNYVNVGLETDLYKDSGEIARKALEQIQ